MHVRRSDSSTTRRAAGGPASTLLLAAFLVGAIAPPAAAQQEPLSDFDRYVAEAVEAWGAPGLAVAVVKDGETVFAEGFGVLDAGEPDRVDAETLFAIGSTTKAMTAATVGMLVDEGRVDWDDPVTEHLPWFRLADPWLTSQVTVRDLLTHRAGLGNADMLWTSHPDRSPEEVVRALAHLEPVYSLRSDFIYQNIMYAAAGEVVREVSGMPWTEFVRIRIFEPLGMDRTVATLAETEDMENVASPHDVVDGELTVVQNTSVDPVAAAGSVWSGVDDMARWLAFLLRGCETEAGVALLEPETCEELFTPQTVLDEPQYPTARLTEPHWSTYGLAWFQEDYEGRKVDFHTGSISGMVAIAGLIRDEGLGVYVLSNRDHVEVRHALMYRVFDLYDDDPPRDWSAEIKALYDDLAAQRESAADRSRASRVEGTTPSRSLEHYEGTYRNPVYGSVEVTLEDGTLSFDFGSRRGSLEHWHFDTFQAVWELGQRGSSPVTFMLDASAEPYQLVFAGREFRRVEGGGEG